MARARASRQDGSEPPFAVTPPILEAGHFHDLQLGAQRTHIHDGLNLKAITVQIQGWQHICPERIVAIAEIGVRATE
jgi:hypothetical protein